MPAKHSKSASSVRHHVTSACAQCRRSKIKVYNNLPRLYLAYASVFVSDPVFSATENIPPADNAL